MKKGPTALGILTDIEFIFYFGKNRLLMKPNLSFFLFALALSFGLSSCLPRYGVPRQKFHRPKPPKHFALQPQDQQIPYKEIKESDAWDYREG